jgi:hypothetical protein
MSPFLGVSDSDNSFAKKFYNVVHSTFSKSAQSFTPLTLRVRRDFLFYLTHGIHRIIRVLDTVHYTKLKY